MTIRRQTDGVVIRENVIDDGKLYGRLVQPSRNVILDRNAELRKNPDALRPMQSMGLELTIPVADYYALKKKYPDLSSPDGLTRTLAWKKFLGTAEAIPYKVRG